MKRTLAASSAALSFLIVAGLAHAQNGGPGIFPPNEVDQIKVDMAIEKGIAYLKANNARHLARFNHAKRVEMQNCELVLFTYCHAGVPETDPAFEELFKDMMARKLEATYSVSLQAMVLEEVERVKHQRRIQMCAQFLVDNQSKDGYWGYGEPSIFVEDIPSEAPRGNVSSGPPLRKGAGLPPPGTKIKPTVKNKLKVEKKRDGNANDNSNSQYAALGLRACHDSGIVFEPAVIEKAMEWWRKTQKNEKADPMDLIEGGVNGPSRGTSVATRKAEPQGWCYGHHGDHPPYGSMTAGAVGSLAIFDYMKDNDDGKKRSWKSDKEIHKGLVWLSKNFTVTYNPGRYEHGAKAENGAERYLYYMYALERAGMLYGTEVLGSHKWYPEGAKVLIETQGANGAWNDVPDTCFAILFLKRATRSLDVASGPARR